MSDHSKIMQEKIEDFTYSIIRSRRKTVGIEVRTDGQILVRAPLKMSEMRIRRILMQKKEWLLNNLEKAEKIRQKKEEVQPLSQEERVLLRAEARRIFEERSAHFAEIIGVKYNRIAIREQKTRWGSCSSDQNLNFNWKLILAPPEVLDYVVVHEICHLKEMNHSRAFWDEVEKILPDYQAQKQWLKDNGWKLIEA